MAQLHEGREALDFYESGLQLLKRQHDRIAGNSTEGDATLKQKLCMAYCSVAELFLTDLCFEQDAEQRCQVSSWVPPDKPPQIIRVLVYVPSLVYYHELEKVIFFPTRFWFQFHEPLVR